MKWRPIIDAPLDGTPILACGPYGDHVRRGAAYWGMSAHPQTVSWSIAHPNAPGKATWRDKNGHKQWPTHWMPLPAAPE